MWLSHMDVMCATLAPLRVQGEHMIKKKKNPSKFIVASAC